MHIEHIARGLSYTPDEMVLMAKKVGRLATYCRFVKEEGSKIRIEADRGDTKKDRDQITVAISVFLPKKTFRAESRKFKALDAIDRCIEKLEEQVKSYKEEHTGRGKAHRAKHSNKQRKLAEKLGL